MENEFRCYHINSESNLFDELFDSVAFEDQGKGRKGAVLVRPNDSGGIPIVRTTSKYAIPAQRFKSIHIDLAQQLNKLASLPLDFNNALIETYSNAYFKMGYHSDQALDLENNSVIALFSCYRYPELVTPPRTLAVESKSDSNEHFEIPLQHNSFVTFSTHTNRQFKHKIVLDKSTNPPENDWLGITFRTSKTYIHRHNDKPCFENGSQITLANDTEAREFYSLRSRENKETDFDYPHLSFTLSERDLMDPAPN